MKKLVKKFLIVCAFVFGIAFVSHATVCATINVICGDNGGYASLCADNYDELNEGVEEMIEVLCP